MRVLNIKHHLISRSDFFTLFGLSMIQNDYSLEISSSKYVHRDDLSARRFVTTATFCIVYQIVNTLYIQLMYTESRVLELCTSGERKTKSKERKKLIVYIPCYAMLSFKQCNFRAPNQLSMPANQLSIGQVILCAYEKTMQGNHPSPKLQCHGLFARC